MTLDKIDFPTARVSALLHMASVAINDKEPEKAADLLQRAVDAAGEIEHDEEKIRTLCDIGNLFIEAGRNDAAINTFETAGADSLKSSTIFTAIFSSSIVLWDFYLPAAATRLNGRWIW